MVNLFEEFPKLYHAILDAICTETAHALNRKKSLIETLGETCRPMVLAYTHDYAKVINDAFGALNLSQHLDRYIEEVEGYFNKHSKVNYHLLCTDLECAFRSDRVIQQRILGMMINYNYYVFGEDFEHCIINNAPFDPKML